ncbi:hypothetical protein [Micromonospora sp. CA-246542]|uniref:hypothetical protein n=1 Tax=Micromonospora sp. CA-246542 TaxID=3239959 RepID=UPI003D8E8879
MAPGLGRLLGRRPHGLVLPGGGGTDGPSARSRRVVLLRGYASAAGVLRRLGVPLGG